tara:strand:+ start:7761 stop:8165 length:405 start_codon:yes stop_codon:yes gene_type:complete
MSQIKRIANLVINYTGVDIYSKRRTQDIVDARALFEYIMREDYKVTYATLTDHYRKNGKKRKHDVMIYSVKKFDEEIRHRRKDLNEYYQNILKTEITVRQYQNAYSLISQLKNQKQMRKFRQYMTELLSEPAKN